MAAGFLQSPCTLCSIKPVQIYKRNCWDNPEAGSWLAMTHQQQKQQQEQEKMKLVQQELDEDDLGCVRDIELTDDHTLVTLGAECCRRTQSAPSA